MLNKEKFNEDIQVLDNMSNKYSIATIENDIQTCRQNISDFNVKLMFVGGFSAGKSALINTILGRDLLVEGQLPQTAIATELKYSDREYAELFKDNVCTKINLNEIEQYDPDKYDYVVCHINNEKLKMFKDFVFVDMPGFNSGIERHNKAILRYAGKGNAYVLVIDSDDGEIKGSISDFISGIKNYDNNLAIAISKCDKRTESEISEIADKIQETAQNLFFNEVNIAKVSKMNPEETTAEMVEVINNFDTQSIFNQTVAVDVVSMIDKCLSALKIKKSGLQLDNDEIEKAINAKKQAKQLEDMGFGNCPICMAKTQYSLTDDQTKLGAPKDFEITVRNLKISAGAGFIVALTGDIMTMPGLPKVPAAERIDVDETGKISGLF